MTCGFLVSVVRCLVAAVRVAVRNGEGPDSFVVTHLKFVRFRVGRRSPLMLTKCSSALLNTIRWSASVTVTATPTPLLQLSAVRTAVASWVPRASGARCNKNRWSIQLSARCLLNRHTHLQALTGWLGGILVLSLVASEKTPCFSYPLYVG